MPDASHARDAKALASKMYRRGKLTEAQFNQINRKADQVLAEEKKD